MGILRIFEAFFPKPYGPISEVLGRLLVITDRKSQTLSKTVHKCNSRAVACGTCGSNIASAVSAENVCVKKEVLKLTKRGVSGCF